MTTVRDKTAIVTGGANGIGFQCCRHLLLNGAKTVAILDLANSNGETSAKKLNEEFGNGHALFFPSDVTKFDELEGVFKKAVTALQGLDILINNAGIFNDRNWQKSIEVNFMAVVKSSLLSYDYMSKHKGGKGGLIVNISSILGLIPVPNLPVYVGTKSAVLAFTSSLKGNYEQTGISVRILCPGLTDTNLITEIQNKYLDFVDSDEAIRQLNQDRRQTTDHVGKSLIEIIEKGANGSIWVIQHSEPPLEIELAKYESIRLGEA